LTPTDPGLLAGRVLQLVGNRADAAVTVTHTRQGLTRFANSFIHQNVVDEHIEVWLQLSAAGRPASAVTYSSDDDALRALVDRALYATSLRPLDPGWPGLSPAVPLVGAADVHYDGPTAAAGPDERAANVAAYIAASRGLTAAGFCETRVDECVFANSAGQSVASRYTSAAFDAICRCNGSDGVASTYSSRLADIDGRALGDAAAGRALRGVDPKELPAGSYEVVLEPRCVAYLMDFYSAYAFNGKAVNENRSFLSLGQAQLDPLLSVWDDATDPRHVGRVFDSEGTPKRRTPLVQGGFVTSVCHDRRTAAAAGGGTSTTGHAIAGGEAVGAYATNLFLGPTNGTARPLDALLADVRRGLLVSDFWYTRVLDPKTLVVTGLTRNGVFLVEDGEVGRPVANLRFTQSYASALAPGNVLGVGSDAKLAAAPGGAHLGGAHVPSLRLAEWHFTGNASS
jgi:predicted Zn-dependent protease